MPLVQARCLAHMMDSCKPVFRVSFLCSGSRFCAHMLHSYKLCVRGLNVVAADTFTG